MQGNSQLIKTQYLHPRDGWVPLIDYQGNMDCVSAAAQHALVVWQNELGIAAVYGDLRPPNIPNIYVRCDPRGCLSCTCRANDLQH